MSHHIFPVDDREYLSYKMCQKKKLQLIHMVQPVERIISDKMKNLILIFQVACGAHCIQGHSSPQSLDSAHEGCVVWCVFQVTSWPTSFELIFPITSSGISEDHIHPFRVCDILHLIRKEFLRQYISLRNVLSIITVQHRRTTNKTM